MHPPGGESQQGAKPARAKAPVRADAGAAPNPLRRQGARSLPAAGRVPSPGVSAVLAVLLFLALAAAPARAALDVYLSLPDVPGGATAPGHLGWTPVQFQNHGMAKGGSGSPAHAPLVLLKSVDQGSPALYADLCRATNLPSGQLDFVQSGETSLLFYQITLSNVMVTQIDSSAGSNDVPSETVSLAYRQIAWTYTVLDSSGKPSGTNSATWNLDTGTGYYTNGSLGADSDGDGIPDGWMNQYFGHPTGQAADHSLAGQDADSDGLSNYQEYLAGTNPTRADSVFRVSRINLSSGQVRVTWTSVAGKTYSLYGASTVNGPYSRIAGGIPSAGDGETSYDLPDSPTRQFFRVSVP